MIRSFLLLLVLPFFTTGIPAQNPLRAGKDYAVFFVVSKYDDAGWSPLPEAAAEVDRIAAELRDNYGFQCDIVPNSTKQQILDKIDAYNRRSYGPNDQVLFFFSMHGHYDPDINRGFLIPKEGKVRDAYGNSWLSYDDLGTYLARSSCRHVLLALDACYSGSFGIRNRSRPDAPAYEREPDCGAKIQNALRRSSRLYFSSGSKETRTPARSLFAARLLEALRNGGEGGILRSLDIEYYLARIETPQPESGSFIGHDDGDFVFVRKDACGAGGDPETKAWQSAQQQDTEEAYAFYLSLYPNGRYRPQALAAQRRLQDERAWRFATQQHTAAAYRIYSDAYCPGGRHCEEAQKKLVVKPDLPNMVFVQGGDFQMVSNDGESDEKPVHRVTVSDFYLGHHEVTVEEYFEFANATNYNFPEWMEKGSKYNIQTGSDDYYKVLGDALKTKNHPIVGISWHNAVAYCNWRSEREGLQKVYTISGTTVTANWNANGYRLSTEAEWEYAARSRGRDEKWAGTSTESNLASYGNFCDKNCSYTWKMENQNDGYPYTAPVGSFRPNSLSLYDMSGNVWEWCWDWYGIDYYGTSPSRDPQGPDTGSGRVLRGGGWYNVPADLRCADRFNSPPDVRYNVVGFRLARAAR